jgi:hypothetical protein
MREETRELEYLRGVWCAQHAALACTARYAVPTRRLRTATGTSGACLA